MMWTEEARDLVLERVRQGRAQGKSIRAICRELDVPEGTVRHWMRGVRAHSQFVATMKRTPAEVRLIQKRDANRRYRARHRRKYRQMSAKNGRAYRLRQRGEFHPVLNPNYELAPLHMLWLRASDVLEFVLARMPESDVLPQFDHNSGSRRRWQEMTAGKKTWLRLDAADILLTALVLVVSEMSVEPTYSTKVPA
jgi:transposase-like protein